jgi:hypothetical protein
MKFYVPFKKDGSWGDIFPNPVEPKDFSAPTYNPVVKVVVFMASDRLQVRSLLYSDHLLWQKLGLSKSNKPFVVPPLLDIRASNKSFPPARKAAFCAMKRLPMGSEPFAQGGAIANDDEVEEDF